jgi:sulfur carrier protein ThiS
MIYLDGKEMLWHDGMTVADLLKQIRDSHLYAVVRVNDTVVSQPNFETHDRRRIIVTSKNERSIHPPLIFSAF